MMKYLRIFICILGLCIAAPATFSQDTVSDDARRRNVINKLIQTYKQAYKEKQIDYIELFFSNNALIITETGLKAVGQEKIPHSTKMRDFHVMIENRKQYIDRLRTIFDQNKNIELSTSNEIIQQHKKYEGIYGVYFLQIWQDDGNGDNLEDDMPGFVFMMIDFKQNELQPVIHVRTWQPRSNIKKPSDKFSLEDFRILDF